MSKIEKLTKQLLTELESQGHSIKTQETDLKHVDIWVYKGNLTIGSGSWEIKCGEVAV